MDNQNYKFDDKAHIHTLDDKPLCGVTTVLQVISKPALIQWAANQAVDYIQNNFESTIYNQSEEWDKFLKEARFAHRKKKDKAGDWGTIVHKAIEDWIKENKITVLPEESQQKAFNNFVNWAKENKIEFLESEKHVWSRELWIGGITDLVIKMDGKKYVADIKTSSGIYPEMWAQMGAYHLCLEDMNEHKDIQGYMIVNLKKDGKIDFGLSENMQFNKDFFRAALQLYKLKQIADESVTTKNN